MIRLRDIPSYIWKAPAKLRLGYQCLRAPYFKWVPPGHYYSALPDMEEVKRRSQTIYAAAPKTVAGIDLRPQEQAALLDEFEKYYPDPPFERSANPRSRFFRPNGSFPFQDAFVLYAMMRRARPGRIIEAGSGMSSCVVLDSCEALSLNTKLTFIEPYPEPLLRLVRRVLFSDTTHVSKVGSDVNHVFFEILPRLKPGVIVHFHDIWYPFEYPHDWLLKGMFWNEAYLLRAFLMFNTAFEILFFNSYVSHVLAERIKKRFPLFMEESGASIWLRRV